MCRNLNTKHDNMYTRLKLLICKGWVSLLKLRSKSTALKIKVVRLGGHSPRWPPLDPPLPPSSRLHYSAVMTFISLFHCGAGTFSKLGEGHDGYHIYCVIFAESWGPNGEFGKVGGERKLKGNRSSQEIQTLHFLIGYCHMSLTNHRSHTHKVNSPHTHTYSVVLL